MTTIIRWLDNAVTLAFLLCGSLLLNFVLIGRAAGLNAGEWASWVQAVGSIVAIVGAAWAALHTSSSDRRAERESEREAAIGQLVFARAVLSQAEYALNSLEFHARDRNRAKIDVARNRIESCLSTLEGLFGKANHQPINLALADAYAVLAECRSYAATAVSSGGMDFAHAEVAGTSGQATLKEIKARLDAISTSLGAPISDRIV